MNDYTPTTEEVADAYVQLMHGWVDGHYVTEQDALDEFHRWLNGVMGNADD